MTTLTLTKPYMNDVTTYQMSHQADPAETPKTGEVGEGRPSSRLPPVSSLSFSRPCLSNLQLTVEFGCVHTETSFTASASLAGPHRHSAEVRREGGTSKRVVEL
ncbi:hypothetical protein Bbelb_306050 [Branchiostoma belcheri]|nr:hypothetical protein Bbelb_306050 [Branchiostoma belcheri]